MQNHKTHYVAPTEYFRMKAKKLMVSDAFTDQIYCRLVTEHLAFLYKSFLILSKQ